MDVVSIFGEIVSFNAVSYSRLNKDKKVDRVERLANTELQESKKNKNTSILSRICLGWAKRQFFVLFVLTCISISVLILEICLIVSLLVHNKDKHVNTTAVDGSTLTEALDTEDWICLPITNRINHPSEDRLLRIKPTTNDTLSCVKVYWNIQPIINVVLVVHFSTNDDKRNESAIVHATFLRASNDNDALAYFEAYLDTRHLNLSKDQKLGPWVVNNGISGIGYGRQNRSFVIQKDGLYGIHISITFKYSQNTSKVLTGAVYRQRKEEEKNLFVVNKTVSVTASDKLPAYLDVELRELFHLRSLDEIFVKVSDAGDILPYIVSNVLGIYSVD